MSFLALALGVAAGLAMALQSPTNSALSQKVGNAQATLVSFAGGTALLLVLALTIGQGDLTKLVGVSWWQVLGGLYGAFMVLSITYAVPVLGVALTLTVIMAGQLSMGMVIDANGLFHAQYIPITPLRLLGVAVVVAGIVLVYIGRKRGMGTAKAVKHSKARMALLLGICFLSGVGGAIQAPTNASLGAAIGTVEASFVSFAGGLVLIFIYSLVITKGHFASLRGISKWKMLGGVYGAGNVICVTTATPTLGVSLLMGCLMFGQLGGGMVIDAKGWFATKQIRVDAWRCIGVVLIAAGIVIVTASKLLA